MKSLFVGLVAATLAVFFATSLVAQTLPAPPTPAGQKAIAARVKQKAEALKGNKRAQEAEAKLAAEAKALAPTIVAALKLPCTVADVRHDTAYDGKVILEMSCTEGLGFVTMSATDGTAPVSQDCIPNPKTPQPGSGCLLPANSAENAAKALQPYVARSGSDCVVAKAQTLGQTSTNAVYEVACSDTSGQILQVSLPITSASRAIAQSCLRMASQGINCTLSTPEGNAKVVRALAAKAGRPCTVTDQRYVAATSDGAEIFEVGCSEGAGFMIQTNGKGEYQRTMTCVQASGIGGGCKLTDAAAEIASQHAAYSTIVKAAGFDCTVGKFSSYAPRAGSTINEVIEVGCENRPESAFALITAGKAEVLNCARARVEGYGCAYSKPEDAYPLLTADLKTTRFQTCTVNGHRAMGTSSRSAFIEVSCSDGNPGFVLTYPLGSGKVSEATPCGLASNLGGGCQLPTNKRG